ncbi:DNA cytosine methyltransferase [Actinokineospora diospyrosa]|uniref:DNA cytosine methyltransferase n=1 Tax=Actinokineospora diospyrosa TaxID=103728 RepID=UPI0020A253B9|nr:DNA cytosine methyltransferase [Actinokineospora diospyrosa]
MFRRPRLRPPRRHPTHGPGGHEPWREPPGARHHGNKPAHPTWVEDPGRGRDRSCGRIVVHRRQRSGPGSAGRARRTARLDRRPRPARHPKARCPAARRTQPRGPAAHRLGTVEPVDVLTGGFPCQDISVAGKRSGIEQGTRSGLWTPINAAVGVLRLRARSGGERRRVSAPKLLGLTCYPMPSPLVTPHVSTSH